MSILVCIVVEISLMKNVILQNMDWKKIGQIQGRKCRRRLVPNPTIQQAIINMHTKYEHSSLHGSWEIFDEKFHSSKYGWKENWTNTGKNKHEKAGSQSQISRWRLVLNPTIQQVVINLHTKYEHSSLHGCWEIFDKKFSPKSGWTEGRNRWTDGRMGGRTDENQYTPTFSKRGYNNVGISFSASPPSNTYKIHLNLYSNIHLMDLRGLMIHSLMNKIHKRFISHRCGIMTRPSPSPPPPTHTPPPLLQYTILYYKAKFC